MSYRATVINVMIASPGDVPQERVIVRNVIHEWNSINSEDKKLVLMPIGWETHATPDMGDRPQGIINGQILKKADLLVGVFWARLGSPTGRAESGTVEEIEEHLKSGKPAMIYFSAAPVVLDSVDLDQYGKLKEFKKTLKDRGLFWEYENLSNFERELSKHLGRLIIQKFCTEEEKSNPKDRDSDTRQAIASILLSPVSISHEQFDHPLAGRAQRMSKEARSLLSAVNQDRHGTLLSLRALDGASVQTNGINFVERGNPRSEAKWRGAVQELESQGFIEDRNGKGEVYYLTSLGYDVAELLMPG